MVKAIAEQRGWEHSRHRYYRRTASRLRAETGDGDIFRRFDVASTLHENDMVAESLNDVEVLLNVPEPLCGRLPANYRRTVMPAMVL
jgi:hypothetical protein